MGSRWRGSLIHGKRLAGVTAQGPKIVFSSAVVLKVFQTNYERDNEFLYWLINSPCALAGSIGLRHCNLCTGQGCACALGVLTFCNANNSIKLISLSCIIGHVHRIVTVLVIEMKA